MLHKANQSTLVLVDLQQRLMPSIFEGERVIKEAVRLAKVARILEVFIIGTEQNPEGIGENVLEVKQLCDRSLRFANVCRPSSAGIECHGGDRCHWFSGFEQP